MPQAMIFIRRLFYIHSDYTVTPNFNPQLIPISSVSSSYENFLTPIPHFPLIQDLKALTFSFTERLYSDSKFFGIPVDGITYVKFIGQDQPIS